MTVRATSRASFAGLRCLCIDCLRVHNADDLTPDETDPPGRCPACAGSTCCCDPCTRTIARLEAGDFLAADAGLIDAHQMVAWSAAGGIVIDATRRRART